MQTCLSPARVMLRLILAAGVLTAPLLLTTGCADERREVRVTEKQERGEVREESPGEMIVE